MLITIMLVYKLYLKVSSVISRNNLCYENKYNDGIPIFKKCFAVTHRDNYLRVTK